MNKKIGKTQSVSREFNTKYVIDLLKNRSYSGTELTDILKLSSATISSIIKDLLAINFIKVSETISNGGHGRRRVMYSLNSEFGYILSVAISNYKVVITLADVCENTLDSLSFDVEKYDVESINKIAEESKKLVEKNKVTNRLKDIIVSVPGRVNSNTGELVLSAQFDKELFKEKYFIQNVFKKTFKGVDCCIANDINLSCLGEKRLGKLKDSKNALYIYVDTGIGGSFVINKNVFTGDSGYAGEFGLISSVQDNNQSFLDDFVSLRSIKDKVNEKYNAHYRVRDLAELFKKDKFVHDEVMKSARTLGNAVLTLVRVIDISKIILAGRVVNFGKEYLDELRNEISKDIYNIDVDFADSSDAQTAGAISLANEYIFNSIVRKNQ